MTFLALFFATITPIFAGCEQSAEHIREKNWHEAYVEADKQACPEQALFAQWMHLRKHPKKHTFAEYVSFMRAHPKWPWQQELRRNAEKMLTDEDDLSLIKAWFDKTAPRTYNGYRYYIKSHNTRPKEVIRTAWIRMDLGEQQEKDFFKDYGRDLRAQDHRKRFERLMRDRKTGQAKRMIARLNKQDLAKLRIRAVEGDIEAGPDIKRLARRWQTLATQRDFLRWFKKHDDLQGAEMLLSRVPVKSTKSAEWWKIRNFFAREAFNQGNYQLAYKVMNQHPFKKGANFAEAEFFLGWLSLKYRDQPKTALKHFENLRAGVRLPASQAKANYWLARTYDVLGDQISSKKHYLAGAADTTTYYGQLCSKQVHGDVKIALKPDQAVDTSAYDKKEFVQVARMLADIGAAREALPFLYILVGRTRNYDQAMQVLQVIRQVLPGYTAFATRDLVNIGTFPYEWAYPVIAKGQKIHGVDANLVHAIIRQESGFDAQAVSHAGAHGLMQLMPGTAQKFCEKAGEGYDKQRLLDDTDYNIKIGCVFMQEMLDEFAGSPLPTIASYNAGHVPAHRWVEKYGDPQDGSIAEVDWIEGLPYYETRGYLQLVLANLGVYKAMTESGVI